MILFPAIDLYEGKAVRLFKGDYDKMTVYGDPLTFAEDFVACGAKAVHIVDLEGAKTGRTPNLDVVCSIKEKTGLFCEIGGGVRAEEIVDRYVDAGLDRVILGTVATQDDGFVCRMVKKHGDKIAVGADIKDGFIAVKGWTEKSNYDVRSFFRKMQSFGVKTVICTDVSKDGVLQGPNLALYKELQEEFSLQITASGGVSTIEDVKKLSAMGVYGAIVGKAYYTGAFDLREGVKITI